MNVAALFDWASRQDVKPGTAVDLPLPPELAASSQDGKATIAHVDDGRRFILLKTELGWRGNFQGVLLCDSAMRPDDIMTEDDGTKYVSLPVSNIFEQLSISATLSPRAVNVFFDLF